MKNSLLSSLFVLCTIITFSININAEDWTKVRKTIEDINDKMEKAIVSGELESMTMYYTEDVISLPDFEPAMRGIQKIKEKAKKDMEAGFKVTAADFKTTDVVGSGDLAVEVGEWDMTMNIPGMDQPWSDKGKYVTVWQKQSDGSWKVKIETWNTNTNPMMASDEEKKAE